MYHKRNTHDSTQSRNSLEQENTNLQNTAIEYRDNSNDDVKSFVIVNDIDLDEELSRAQKNNKNFFQVLSMNFYGKARSHSFDNVEPKKSEKSPMSSKAEVKPMMSRKGSGHSLLDKKTCASTPIKEEKPKTAMPSKKKTSPVKGLDIVTEKFSRPLGSPKESSRKVSSPKAMTKKNLLIGNLTSKASAKREPLFFFESQQKSPVANKKVGDRQNKSPDNKGNSQLNSQLAKKTGLSNLLKKSETMPENIEETVQTLSVEPSAIDIRPIEFEESEIEKKSVESSVKEKKSSTKESSRRGSDNQVNKEKATLSSLSARILATPVKLQSKPVHKEVVQKTGGEEKLTKLQLGDIHDMETEADNKKRQGSGSVRNQVIKGKKGYDRSPDTGKHSERTPVVASSGAAYQGMKIILANKESLTPKVTKKAQSKEISTSVLESKKTSFDQNEDQGKNKKSSLGRLDMLNPTVKKVESVGQVGKAKTPKFDGVKKGERSWKVLDASDKIMKDQKRTQPTSPASGETRKVLNFFDKLASLKKREKI